MKKAEAKPEELCAYQPENQKATCATVAASMKKNRDVTELLKGCVDKTGPKSLFDKWRRDRKLENRRWPTTDAEWAESENFVESEAGYIQKKEKECPPLCACNAIESYTGAPMCGVKLRGWGDFLPSYYRPVPPNGQDTFPSDDQSVQTFHAFESANPDCEMCVDLFNQLNLAAGGEGKGAGFLEVAASGGGGALAGGDGSGTDLCKEIPEALKLQCAGVANPGPGRGSSPNADYPGFAQRRDVYKLLKGGCVDLSTITPIEQIPGKCPGIIACNIIRDPFRGGPMCGTMLRQWGDFAIPDGAEAVKGEPPLQPCPVAISGTGNSLPCPSTMRHG